MVTDGKEKGNTMGAAITIDESETGCFATSLMGDRSIMGLAHFSV